MSIPSNYKKRRYIGRALIINNKTFNNYTNIYSNSDLRVIKEKLRKLRFHGVMTNMETEVYEATTFTDVKVAGLKRIFKEVAENDFSNYSCFVCVILSCGEPGVVYCQREDDTSYETCQLKDLQKPFKEGTCHWSLIGKPKIFLIQAYPYREQNQAVPDSKMVPHKIPTESDFLVHFSQQQESETEDEEHPESGYVQALTEALEEYCIQEKNEDGTLHFLRMLTKVHQKMIDHGRRSRIPLVTSTLRKRLYLQLSDYKSQNV